MDSLVTTRASSEPSGARAPHHGAAPLACALPVRTASAPTTASSCPICHSAATTRVTCPSCQYTTCCKCVKKWLLSQMRHATCMQCRTDWTLSLHTLLPATFLDGVYRKHRAIILLEREKALLPASQDRARAMAHLPRVEAALRQIRNQKDKLLRRNRRYLELQARLKQPGGTLRPEDAFVDDSSDDEAAAFRRRRPAAGGEATLACGAPANAPVTYVRACPSPACRGFVTDRWVCGLCAQQVCRHCHEMVHATGGSSPGAELAEGAPHACHPDQVASAQLIAAQTKPCPTCMAPIRKADGCQDMFCWSCKSGFNWKTRRPISLDRLHNPHFFQWQQVLRTADHRPDASASASTGSCVSAST